MQGRRLASRACLRKRAFITVLVAASAYAVTAQAALAAAGPFKKDRTPLPESVTNGSTGGGGITDASSGAGAIARMVVGLAIVLAVVYGVYRPLKKRYRGGSRGGGVADGRLEIVATTPLANNRAVHLLRAGDELFLVGSSEQSVTGLAAWGPEEARRLEAVLAMLPPAPPQPTQPVGIRAEPPPLTLGTLT